MQIVIVGFGVFLVLMAAGIGGAHIAGVTFDGGGYGALFLVCVVGGGASAAARAAWDEDERRDR